MTTGINGALLAISSSLAASIVAKATLSMVLGLVVTWLARRNRAAVRHVLLAAAFGVLAGLPVAAILAPPVRIAVPGAPQRAAVANGNRVNLPGAAARPSADATPAKSTSLPLSALLLSGWIAGIAIFLLPVATGLWQVRGLRRSGLPWPQAQQIADGLAGRRVDVLLHEGVPGPMTCGLLHPAILLPRDAQTWDNADLNRAIVHELEHVRRGDWVSHCIARVVCAVYWFHPLVWTMWRRFSLEAERACDDAVLARAEATAYADQLVGLARRLSAKPPFLAMANRADLSARVGAVLDSAQPRGRAGRSSVWLACTAAALLVAGIAPLHVVASPQDAGTGPRPQFMVRTGLVIVDVIVSDRNGIGIEDLTANDFSLAEDGKPQKIHIFEFQKASAFQSGVQSVVSGYYLLGYYANPNGEEHFRNIKVTCTKFPEAKLDYRAGYYTNKTIVAGAGGAPGTGRNGAVAPGTAVAVDPNTKPPILLRKVDPEYSEEARKAKYQGSVVLQVEVDITGHATNIQVLRSLGLGLDEKAVEAVRKWQFRPGIRNGQPIAMQTNVNVDFRLF